MDALSSHVSYIWLIAGAILIIFEAATVPGLGIFLGGLGAICTGILIEAGYIDASSSGAQFACFLALTAFWALVLWKPMLKFRGGIKGKHHAELDNVVGGSAIVDERGLKRGETGQVLWSGTVMKAELDDSTNIDSLSAGSHVTIKSISGTTFKVIPKNT